MRTDPTRYLVGGQPSAVILPARVCRLLDRNGLDQIRRRFIGADAEFTAVLSAIQTAGLQWVESKKPRSGFGMSEYRSETTPSSSSYDLDAGAVAEQLGIGRRAVVALANRGSIKGYKSAGRWLFPPENIAAYLAGKE